MTHPVELERALQEHFGFASFRPGQKEVISNAVNGIDTLAILPTGSGKSLCYQLPALLHEGLTIVVSPLISLMIDQVKQMKAKGRKKVAALHSFLNPEERKNIFRSLGRLDLLYISPEMLVMPRMKEALKQINVSLFVVDEAHCISQWGHEFRTDYLKISRVMRELNDPPLLAVSATATPEVQEDILKQLERNEAERIIHPMDKPNIQFGMTVLSSDEEKLIFLKRFLKRQRAPVMVYFSSRQTAEKISEELKKENLGRVGFYHGGMEPVDRQLVQQQFMRNELDIICCTSAFGMGIDKPDIRLVIHFHLPPRVESFIQEVGRAGRDGGECTSILLYSPGDERLPRMFIESELPSDLQIEEFSRFMATHRSVPSMEEISLMELSESQYNFLLYQAETLRPVMPEETDTFLQKVKKVKRNREEEKKEHLERMTDVLRTDGCRRKQLYRHFQSELQPATYLCCDRCDSSIFDVTYTSTQKRMKVVSWEKRLAALFAYGDSDEG